MTEHKFKIGLLVHFYPKRMGLLPDAARDAARGMYQIIQRLPAARDGEFQYAIRSSVEGHNRVARESELIPV